MKSSLHFPEFLQRLADTCATLERRLHSQMHSDSCPGGDPARCCIAAKGGSLPTKSLNELVAAARNLGGEIRSWEGHVKTNLDRMTPARKAQVMIKFLQDQPLSARLDVYSVLAGLERDRPDGLVVSVTNRFSEQPA